MNRFCTIAVGLALVWGLGGVAEAGDGKDDVVGTRWEYTIASGGEKHVGAFRVFRREIFKGDKKIGAVRPHPRRPDQSTLVITELPQLNGSTTIRKTGRKPPVWRGTLTRPDGSTSDIRFVVKDF